MSTPGIRIKNARIAQRLSIENLAKKTGICRRTLYLTEKNITALSSDNLLKICNVLGISADFALTGNVTFGKTVGGFVPVNGLILEIYNTENLAIAFSAMQGLKMEQIELLISMAKTMAVDNGKQKR